MPWDPSSQDLEFRASFISVCEPVDTVAARECMCRGVTILAAVIANGERRQSLHRGCQNATIAQPAQAPASKLA